MKYLFLTLIFVLLNLTTIISQNIVAYTDDRGQLYFFNDGQKVKLEHQPVSSLKIGYNNICYIDSRKEFIYYSPTYKKVKLGVIDDYKLSDYICAFTQNTALSTINNNQKLLLTNSVGSYAIGDSLIAFNDNIKKGFYAYYNNQIIELENNIIEEEANNFIAAENTIAYFNAMGYFKVFSHGKLTKLNRPNSLHNYKVGQNIVAYSNNDNETFNVYTNNKSIILEDATPTSFECGDDLVAYVDIQGVFKVYKDGEIQEISSYAPTQYSVVDQLIIYENLGRFSIFYNNKNYELENYWVEGFKADNNSLVYIDKQGCLVYFHDGKVEKITTQTVTSYSLRGNVLQYSLNTNRFPVVYQGKTW